MTRYRKSGRRSKTYIDKKGYKRYKNSKKSVHSHVASRKIGGKIGKGRVVHHRDGNKRNNKRSNLQVMSRSAHSKLHSSERKKKKGWFW